MLADTPVVISRIQNRRGLQADFDALYPAGQPGTGSDVLQPGELALCTDTGNVYIGTIDSNIPGYYILIGSSGAPGPTSDISLIAVVSTLPPANVWTPILAPINETPFFTILYSLVDVTTTNPNVVGTNFAKNGKLTITSTTSSATLVDDASVINSALFDVNFRVDKIGSAIQLSYMHNFPTPITFSTGSVIWAPI